MAHIIAQSLEALSDIALEVICLRCAGPNTGLGLENMKHVISIHDVVSDTMHQFAPTYHNYVLYSNQGSKEAPKTVSASPQRRSALSSLHAWDEKRTQSMLCSCGCLGEC